MTRLRKPPLPLNALQTEDDIDLVANLALLEVHPEIASPDCY
jgi:hypothetical protein